MKKLGYNVFEVFYEIGFLNLKEASMYKKIWSLLILYLLAQRKFIEGIERTGMTGE